MADSRFFTRQGPFTLSELAEMVGGELSSHANPTQKIEDIAPLDKAGGAHLSCFHNTKYTDSLKVTQAAVVVLHPDHAEKAPKGCALIVTKQPYRAFGKIAGAFYPAHKSDAEISTLASIHSTVKIGAGCSIAPFAVIGANVVIGRGSAIGPHVVISEGVEIGEECVIDSHVSISHAIIGNRVYIKPGARIGQSGFGFHMDEHGHFPIPQVGRVLIGDNVEIGANTTIDRGAEPDTIIGRGSRIDNLVQLGHNVQLGDHCVIVAQVGISGSTQLGKFVIAAGQVGIAGHLKIGDGVKMAAKSGIMRDIEKGETVAGMPAIPVKEWHRQTVTISKLSKGKRS